MSLKQTIAPTEEPITLQDAKDFLRVDGLEDDDLITSLIVSARQRAETITRRALITQTFALKADDFPCWLGNGWWRFDGRNWPQNAIVLPMPAASVTSIQYRDSAGVLQTMLTSDYVVDTDNEPARITLPVLGVWPVALWQASVVTITFTAGYGAAAAVPDGVKTAIKMLVAHWYDNRSPVVTGTIATKLPLTVEALLDPFCWGSYA